MQKYLAAAERFIDKAFDIIVMLVLVVGIYYAVDVLLLYNDADADGVMGYKPTHETPKTYKELSKDCVGWICLYNTKIDYPIMQGVDNMEYLNKDPYGAYSLSGSIYLDSRNDSRFRDSYSLLYGHNVDGGHMFGGIEDFENRKYFNNHKKGELIVDGKYHKIEAFAFAHTNASEGLLFNPEVRGDRTEWINANANIKQKSQGKRIVALSTCTTPTSTLRMILFVYVVD